MVTGRSSDRSGNTKPPSENYSAERDVYTRSRVKNEGRTTEDTETNRESRIGGRHGLEPDATTNSATTATKVRICLRTQPESTVNNTESQTCHIYRGYTTD